MRKYGLSRNRATGAKTQRQKLAWLLRGVTDHLNLRRGWWGAAWRDTQGPGMLGESGVRGGEQFLRPTKFSFH